MEKRRYQRVSVDGLRVIVTDGAGFFSGEIYDVSQDGMQLARLPECFDENKDKIKLMIFGIGCRFKMVVKPRWSYFSGNEKSIGFKIEKIPWEWTEFIMGSLAGASCGSLEKPMVH